MECLLAIAFLILLVSISSNCAIERMNRSPKKTVATMTPRRTFVDRRMDCPGWFNVLGVDRATGFETKERVYASSSTAARAKCEVNGILVTFIIPSSS